MPNAPSEPPDSLPNADSISAPAGNRPPLPILTATVCAICVIVFAGLHQQGAEVSHEILSRWGYSTGSEVRSGAIWALLTSTFVHIEPVHLIFNLYWLWRFGVVLEQTIGRPRWAAYYLTLALISSAAELTAGGETGIGASGVVYGFFGCLWMSRRNVPAFASVVTRNTIRLFLWWFAFCVALTVTNIYPVGNFAHGAGLLAGVLLAMPGPFRSRRRLAIAAIAALALISSAGIFWAPWNLSWTSDQAMKAYDRQDWKRANHWIHRALAQGQDKTWCYDVLMRIATAARDKTAYANALENLRAIDSGRAEETDKEMQLIWLAPKATGK